MLALLKIFSLNFRNQVPTRVKFLPYFHIDAPVFRSALTEFYLTNARLYDIILYKFLFLRRVRV